MSEDVVKEIPRLSYSIAHTLVTKSPLHAWAKHRLLGNLKAKDTEAMDEGKLMEKFVLGCDLDKLVIVDAANWQGGEAKALKAKAIEDDLHPVLRKHYNEAKANAEVIIDNFKAQGVDLRMESDEANSIEVFIQLKLLWTSPEGVLCSGVIDRLVLDHRRGKATIYDLKTTSDGSNKKLSRSVYDYGYHIQKTSYEEAVGQTWPEFLGRIRTVFLFCEKEQPFVCRALELAGSMSVLGTRAWQEAKQTWQECYTKDEWPGYEVAQIEAQPWMLAESMDIDSLAVSDGAVMMALKEA